MNSTRLSIALLLSIAVLGSLACGGGGEEAGAPNGGDQPALQEAASNNAAPATQDDAEPGETFCAHLSTDDINEALGGQLELGTQEGTETGCKVPILFGIDGNALAFGQIPRGNYDAFKGYEDQSSVAFEYLEGLGQEAFVLNNAQVCVLLNETAAITVGAQIVAITEPLPISPEEMKAGLIELTTQLISQL